jgi:hypothetical protein
MIHLTDRTQPSVCTDNQQQYHHHQQQKYQPTKWQELDFHNERFLRRCGGRHHVTMVNLRNLVQRLKYYNTDYISINQLHEIDNIISNETVRTQTTTNENNKISNNGGPCICPNSTNSINTNTTRSQYSYDESLVLPVELN